MSKLVGFSDTHGQHDSLDVPNSTYICFCGDYQKGRMGYEPAKYEGLRFLNWYAALPNQHKIMTVGNHDDWFFYQPEEFIAACNERNIHLCVAGWGFASFLVGKLIFAGTQHGYTHAKALIPHRPELPYSDSYDVLLTHCPPYGILDFEPRKLENCGNTEWRKQMNCAVFRPKLHLFGHIHDQYGKTGRFANVALCDNNGKLKQQPLVIDVQHLERK